MSNPSRSRFTFRRRLLEVLMVLWVVAYAGRVFREHWAVTAAASSTPAATASATPAATASATPAATASATPVATDALAATSTPLAAVTAKESTPGAVATRVAELPDSPPGGPWKGIVPKVAGVVITVVKPGEGKPITTGGYGSFHYTGWLQGFQKGKPFDSSRERGPYEIQLGTGMVIPGWDKGLIGMQPGEVRRLKISPEMAYGDDGLKPTIPPKSTIYYEVEFMGLYAIELEKP